MKRVWCLYRVSTKQQVSVQDDLPVQRAACRAFVESKKDWQLTNELIEKGVSGWSKRADERDTLQQLLTAAKAKQFDILLLYMLDRIGRREDELPFIMGVLQEAQIEVWSVAEGKWRVDNHTDKLVNYIRYWQAEGESVKTSVRVKEAKRQLSAAGYFQGGTIPYGYRLVECETVHWKDKRRQQKILMFHSEEAQIVKKIFQLYTEKYYGYRKIIDTLTKEGVRNRQGRPFCVSTIKRILGNPIYIGTARYNSLQTGVQPFNKQLQIIPTEQFERAQRIQKSRQNQLQSNEIKRPRSNRLLLSGLLYCGYCHSKLTGHYIYRSADDKPILRYQCPQNHGRLAHQHEQTIWSAKKYEQLIVNEVIKYIQTLDFQQLYHQIELCNEANQEDILHHINHLQQQINHYQKKIHKLKEEIPRVLLAESHFSAGQLSEVLHTIENKKEIIESNLLKQQRLLKKELIPFEVFCSEWTSLIEQASNETKQSLLYALIHRVLLKKNEVYLQFHKCK